MCEVEVETLEFEKLSGRMLEPDSESLYDPEMYRLLREDSLLVRHGSDNFAALLETPEPATPQNTLIQQQEIQQNVITVPAIEGNLLEIHQEMFYQVNPAQEHEWGFLDESQDVTQNEKVEARVVEGEIENLVVADSSSTTPPPIGQPVHIPVQTPSLQPWAGRYAFNVAIPLDNKDRNKWCFSGAQHKLYTCPNVAIPISVTMNQWLNNVSIVIIPVYKESRFRVDPVKRCYNCKFGPGVKNGIMADHIIQVDGEGCEYIMQNDRHVVSVPLHPPPPGDNASQLLVKLTCLTSCVGGPNRRIFSLVFSLRENGTGREIGRQVIEAKCCKCPSRDMNNEDKQLNQQQQQQNQSITFNLQDKITMSNIKECVGQKRKRPQIKTEPGSGIQYLPVPEKYIKKMKKYLNCLVAKDNTNPNSLPFPDVE